MQCHGIYIKRWCNTCTYIHIFVFAVHTYTYSVQYISIYVHMYVCHANAPPFLFYFFIFSVFTKEVKIIFSKFFYVYTYLHTYIQEKERIYNNKVIDQKKKIPSQFLKSLGDQPTPNMACLEEGKKDVVNSQGFRYK